MLEVHARPRIRAPLGIPDTRALSRPRTRQGRARQCYQLELVGILSNHGILDGGTAHEALA